MAENISPSFEEEIKELSSEVEARLAGSEKEKAPLSGKEALREIMEEKIYAQPSPAAPQSSVPAAGDNSPTPSYLSSVSSDVKEEVEKLIGAVFFSGLNKAIKEARRKPAFVLDAFHDALVDKLHGELEKRGLIKNG